MKRWGWVAALLMMVFTSAAAAHEVRPAFLEISEHADGRADVLWKQPTQGEIAVALRPEIGTGLLNRLPDVVDHQIGYSLARWNGVALTRQGLDGQQVRIDGLDRTITDALLIVHLRSGDTITQLLSPSRPAFTIAVAKGMAVPAYLRLGIEHILTGIDHLLFVFGLILLCSSLRGLLQTITAFTAAHSITLALSALRLLNLDPALVESFVALSIVCLAVELAYKYQGRPSVAQRYPWAVAFSFGLMHGAAFAGTLRQIGLPADHVPAALLLFNVGVEIGQIIFVASVGACLWLLRPIAIPARAIILTRWACIYAIGTFSTFWFFERAQAAFATIS